METHCSLTWTMWPQWWWWRVRQLCCGQSAVSVQWSRTTTEHVSSPSHGVKILRTDLSRVWGKKKKKGLIMWTQKQWRAEGWSRGGSRGLLKKKKLFKSDEEWGSEVRKDTQKAGRERTEEIAGPGTQIKAVLHEINGGLLKEYMNHCVPLQWDRQRREETTEADKEEQSCRLRNYNFKGLFI